jgi:hypothetical protein
MLSTKTRNIVITAVASLSFASAAVAPAVSQAKPRNNQGLELDCRMPDGHGGSFWYQEGTVMTYVDPVTGKISRKECINGEWVPLVQTGGAEAGPVAKLPGTKLIS